ncbi:MAG: Fe-S cluster assembly scaffold protein NifU [Candidatus Aminicenantes bacterium]|nr:MAG: Fe-S cluster assembly scaffold protein NifU [Candidatus Aminicenantes bacterium]
MYSEKVMEHFQNPRNVGTMKDADGIGEIGNPVCGDMMTFYIKVKDNRIEDVKFQTFGCGAAIAVSSMVSEMAIGKTLEEALKITNKSVAEELGGLPKNKLHCSNLGADALHNAIENYKEKKKVTEKPAPKKHVHGEECCCPYCDGPLEGMEEICHMCKTELEECPECGKPTNKKEDKCLHCGATKVRT